MSQALAMAKANRGDRRPFAGKRPRKTVGEKRPPGSGPPLATGSNKNPNFVPANTDVVPGRNKYDGGRVRYTHAKGKARRNKPGASALREIVAYQKTTEWLIPRGTFRKLVREISNSIAPAGDTGMRWQDAALSALQEDTEAFLVAVFESTQLIAIHSKRITIQQKDMQLLIALLKNWSHPTFKDW